MNKVNVSLFQCTIISRQTLSCTSSYNFQISLPGFWESFGNWRRKMKSIGWCERWDKPRGASLFLALLVFRGGRRSWLRVGRHPGMSRLLLSVRPSAHPQSKWEECPAHGSSSRHCRRPSSSSSSSRSEERRGRCNNYDNCYESTEPKK